MQFRLLQVAALSCALFVGAGAFAQKTVVVSGSVLNAIPDSTTLLRQDESG